MLTLVGDFDPDDALAKVKKYFGVDSRAARAAEGGPRRGSRTTASAARPSTIRWRACRSLISPITFPPGNTPENYAAQELAVILGEGQSSRLYQHLVKDKQLAAQVETQADSRIGPSLFYITATPRPGVKVEDLEKGVDDEIAAVVKDGVTAEELAKAKTQLLRKFIEQRRSDLSTANLIGRYTVYFGDPSLINTIVDKESAVTVDEANAAARKYFVRDQRAVVVTLPEPKDAAGSQGAAQ